MRLFIAIALPERMRRELARVKIDLQRRSESGRFVPPGNFHVTLHFIGESERLADAVSAMREAVRGIRPFQLALGEYSSFDRGGSVTSVVTVEGDMRELNALYESLQAKLGDYGFKREHRRFRPHITLGRGVVLHPDAEATLSQTRFESSMRVNAITLYESLRTQAGMEYVALHTERLE
ncbi:MAG: RNA 2',3'-cyclic phosphodiesterase [Clostridia bacterium]|nr:RNA 2',3'-cyclic phosphodiesterase [Clostridia bacterium]